VCGSRLASWYVLTLIITLAALAAVGLFLFRETPVQPPF
jgi:hypothetical protein